jgi:hypothetical protein
MRSTDALAPLAPLLPAVPAVVYDNLPAWALLALLGVAAALTAVQVVVTQVIRVRASGRITSSKDNLRVLEIEDLPRPGRGSTSQ